MINPAQLRLLHSMLSGGMARPAASPMVPHQQPVAMPVIPKIPHLAAPHIHQIVEKPVKVTAPDPANPYAKLRASLGKK